jgi:hypothetical protein
MVQLGLCIVAASSQAMPLVEVDGPAFAGELPVIEWQELLF